jgi:midasin (ATPase involved in ribosome maturation)
MMYKIVKYQSEIASKDAETQKRYNLIEKLSKGFTIENEMAIQLDKLLVEQLELEGSAKQIKSSKPNSPSKDNEPNEDIKQRFNDLFDAIKNNTGNKNSKAAQVNSVDIEKAIEESLIKNPIKFNQLHESIKDRLLATPHIIKYELSERKSTEFKNPEITAFHKIIDDVMMGNNVFLVGGAGTGKTYLAEQLVSKMALGRPHITINCSQWTSPTEIIGGQTMDGYVEGKLIEAWQHGYILILDELPKIDPNTAGLFNDALAKTKIPNAVIFNARKESFVKHPDFGCIATGNIYPDKESMIYGANNRQDLSLLDRFSGSVHFIEKNPDIEQDILQNNMIWSICDKIRYVIEELKYEAQMSLRFMLNARDTYDLEMTRFHKPAKNKIPANIGKTLKNAVDSYLSTFTEVQKKNIKERINYKDIFFQMDYRTFDPTKFVY